MPGIVLGTLLLIRLHSPVVCASISLTDDYSPMTYSGAGHWTVGGELIIGDIAVGEMTITGASEVSNTNALLGNIAGSTGTITVTDSGSAWNNSSYLYVGRNGTGILNISNDGTVSNTSAAIAYNPESNGTVTVTGTNSEWINSTSLTVGRGGTGSLTISSGGLVSNTWGYIAMNAGSSGQAVVTGAGSVWTNSNPLWIGRYGHGELTVEEGGSVSSTRGHLGYYAASSGTVTVTGAGSAWTNSAYLNIGQSGTGTMTIADGGWVSNTEGSLGYGDNSSGTVMVTGAGSTWANSSHLYIGGSSDGAAGTGTLTISNGGLVTAQDARIWNSGSLAGNGTLRLDSGSGLLNCYGTISPGNSIGTLTVDGNITFEIGSTLQVEVDNSGNCDLLDVTGDVTINGGTVSVSSDETIVSSQTYTIITARSVTGQFTTLDTALLQLHAMINPDENVDLAYDAASVMLNISVTQFNDPGIPQTPVQREVGHALQVIAEDGGNAVTTELQSLLGTPALLNAYDQLSGQNIPASYFAAKLVTERYLSAASSRMRAIQGGIASVPSNALFAQIPHDQQNISDSEQSFIALGNGSGVLVDRDWGIWGKAFGLWSDRETKASSLGYLQRTVGSCFGLDYQLTPEFLLGITLGYSKTALDSAGSPDSVDIHSRYFGVYSSYETLDYYLDSTLFYVRNHFESRRYLDIGSLHEIAEADYKGQQIAGSLEGGLTYFWKDMMIQPLVGFKFILGSQDSYTETGSSGNLQVESGRYESYQALLGATLTKRLWADSPRNSIFTELRGRWSHEFGNTHASTNNCFVGYTDTFTVNSSGVSRDSFLLGAGVKMTMGNMAELYFDYDFTLNKDYTAHLFTAGLLYNW